MPSATKTNFADATAVQTKSSHEYTANFPIDWCIGTVPNGGFLTSLFLRVANTHFNTTLKQQNQPHTIALHLEFLRRTSTGPALFTVKDIKLGRQTSIIHITLSQAGREEVTGYLTNSNLTTESGITYPTAYPQTLSQQPIPVNLSLLKEDSDPNWGSKKHMPYSKFRTASEKIDLYFPREGQKIKSVSEQWARLSDLSERWTNTSLGFLVDMFPLPADTFLYPEDPYALKTDTRKQENSRDAPAYWYPTLLLNMDIKKALPEKGAEWLYSRIESKRIMNGRMDIEVVVSDAQGEVVAISNHIALAVGAERNVAARRKESAKI